VKKSVRRCLFRQRQRHKKARPVETSLAYEIIFNRILVVVKQPCLLEIGIVGVISLELSTSLGSLLTIVVRTTNYAVHTCSGILNNKSFVTLANEFLAESVSVSLRREATANNAVSLQ
jgi:hypothetical protein